ncbi:MAG: TetR/AcrR family transcriptional regulator [Pseudomonadota bacterium]
MAAAIDLRVVQRANNRNTALLDSAAELFATRGYQASTMRDIASNAGMLSGSIYYHYKNKPALLVAVYEEGVRRLTARVTAAVEDVGDPWHRLERSLATHIEMIVQPSAYASVIIRILPDSVPEVADQLTALRNAYEAVLKGLIAALPLGPQADTQLLRLLLIGAANHVHVWYRADGATPAAIARTLVQMLRCGGQEPAKEGTAS